ncbi:hypothetical protein MMC29_002617 [Sticta canariensis]|nr:hypothetical protein [Sticta canariensis]
MRRMFWILGLKVLFTEGLPIIGSVRKIEDRQSSTNVNKLLVSSTGRDDALLPEETGDPQNGSDDYLASALCDPNEPRFVGGTVTFGRGCPEHNIDTSKPQVNTVQPSESPPGSSGSKDNTFQLELNNMQSPNSLNNLIPLTGWSSDDLRRAKPYRPQTTTESRPRRTTPQRFDPDTVDQEWPTQVTKLELMRINPTQWQPSLSSSSSDRITNIPDGLEPLPGPGSTAEDRKNWIWRNRNKLPMVVDPTELITPQPIRDYGPTP